MRLLVVSDYCWPAGGIEQFVFELLDRVSADAGVVRCQLATWDTVGKFPAGFDDFVVCRFGDVRDVWRAMVGCDVILAVTSFNVRLLARTVLDFADTSDTPIVTVVQNSGHSNPLALSTGTQTRWLGELLRRSSSVVAVSEDVAAALSALTTHDEGHRDVIVIENGARLASAHAPARGRSRVSFIGRPHPQKGFGLFERLAVDLKDTGLKFHANTVSVEPIERLPHVTYSMLLDDNELVSLLDHTDVLVVPYLYADGWPLAITEAINCGVPIIGFDSPGVAPLLRRHGQLVVPATYESLRDAVVRWRNGGLDLTQPIPGSSSTWDVQIARYLEVLRDAVAERRQG